MSPRSGVRDGTSHSPFPVALGDKFTVTAVLPPAPWTIRQVRVTLVHDQRHAPAPLAHGVQRIEFRLQWHLRIVGNGVQEARLPLSRFAFVPCQQSTRSDWWYGCVAGALPAPSRRPPKCSVGLTSLTYGDSNLFCIRFKLPLAARPGLKSSPRAPTNGENNKDAAGTTISTFGSPGGETMHTALQPERRSFVRVPFDAAVRAEPIPRSSTYRVLHMLSEDLSEGGVRRCRQQSICRSTRGSCSTWRCRARTTRSGRLVGWCGWRRRPMPSSGASGSPSMS